MFNLKTYVRLRGNSDDPSYILNCLRLAGADKIEKHGNFLCIRDEQHEYPCVVLWNDAWGEIE